MSRTWLRWAFSILGAWVGLAMPVLAWNTLPSRADDEPGFTYTPSPADWRKVNMYQIMTDRFSDGDSANNTVNGHYDPKEGFAIHGGDFAGLRQKLGYLQGMGVKAIWISPVQFSVNAYHAYAPTDFNRIETHFGSLKELRDMIDDAHARGIYVILDIVINHMADRIGSTDAGFPAFKNGGYNMKWWDDRWKHAPPFDRIDRFHNFGEIDNYEDSWKVLKGEFKPGGLDDLKTTDTGVQDDLIRIFKALIDATDCDGFRIDAVKHVEQEFFARFMPAIYAHAAWRGKNNFLVFGESIDGNDNTLSGWTYPNYHFNSMLYFPMYYKMVDVFVHRQRTSLLTERINDLWKYSQGSRYQLVNFLDNHDTWRIMYDNNLDGDTWRLRPALTFLYTSLQIPCLYYGTEQGFDGGKDPWNREDMFDGGFEWGPSNGDNFNTNSMLYQFVRQLNQFREAYPALTVGSFHQLWQTTDGAGIYAYAKRLGDEEVMVALNTHWENRNCQPASTRPEGTTFVNLFNRSETLKVTGGKLNINLLGHDQKIFAVQRSPLWIGNLSTWPGPTHNQCPDGDCNPTLEPAEDLWVDVETRPTREGQSVKLFYRTSASAEWTGRDMGWNFNGSQGSHWNVNLGSFPAGTTIEYFARATELGEEAFANSGGSNYFIRVTDPHVPSEASYYPSTIVNCEPLTILYFPNDGPLSSATNIIAHLGRNGWQDIITPALKYEYDGMLGGKAWRLVVAPLPGSTEINVVFHDGNGNWDNNDGKDWRISISGCDFTETFAITNPPSGAVFAHDVSSFTLQGVAGKVNGHIAWSNNITGGHGKIAAQKQWMVASLPLGVGENVITAHGFNTGTVVKASDQASDVAYEDGWADGDNGGTGFSSWVLRHDRLTPEQAGWFTTASSPSGGIGAAWGLYANQGKYAEAKRSLAAPLQPGDTFKIKLDHGFIDPGAGIGIALQNQIGGTCWQFWFNGGDTNYNMTGGNTDLAWTPGGIDLEVSILSNGNFHAVIRPLGGETRNYIASFESPGPVHYFRAWNYNAGVGSDHDVLFGDVKVDQTVAGPVTGATIVVTRRANSQGDSNGDGIPDHWCNTYGFNPSGPSIAHLDPDGDGTVNLEEFIADTHPNNAASVYNHRVMTLRGGSTVSMHAGPPTSPNRRYDVYWTTNLNGGVWMPAGLNMPGNANSNAVILTVTNSLPGRFYRTGVRLP